MTQRRLITSDCHIAAPFSVLDELPESYRQYFPLVEERADEASARSLVAIAARMVGSSSTTRIRFTHQTVGAQCGASRQRL